MQWDKLIQEMPLGFNLREMIWDEKKNPVDYRFLDINDAYQAMTGLKKRISLVNEQPRFFRKLSFRGLKAMHKSC